MACETCDHTMEHVGITGNGGRVFHCPRCGMLSQCFGNERERHNYIPKLVERCRQFEHSFPPGNPPTVSYSDYWRMLGITESINVPAERPI